MGRTSSQDKRMLPSGAISYSREHARDRAERYPGGAGLMAVRIVLGIVGFLLLALALRGVWGSFDPILISLLILPAFIAAGLCL